MAQPTPYIKSRTFTDASGVTYPVPASFLDQEFGLVQIAIASTDQDLKLIQRDDGALANGVVTPDALSPATVVLLGGWNPRGPWATGVVYSARDLIAQPEGNYIAVAKHVSGNFPADLASGKWQFVSSTAVAPTTTVNLFSDLRAISSAPSVVIVGGRTVVGDGGGGTFTVDLTDTTSVDNGGTILVDVLNRRWKRVRGGNIIFGAWFGIKDDGADYTTHCQAVVDLAKAQGRGTIVWPSFTIKTTATIYVKGDNIAMYGGGQRVTTFLPVGDFGDVFYVQPTGAATQILNFTAKDFTIYTASDTTNGANLHLERVTQFVLDVELQSRFGGLLLESVRGGRGSFRIQSDDNFAAFRSGSYLVKVIKHSAGVTPSENWFSNCELRGNLSNNYLHYGVLVQDCDGFFMTNSHVGMCNTPYAIMPRADNSQISNIKFTGGQIDTGLSALLLVTDRPGGAYAGVFGPHDFSGTDLFNCTAGPGLSWTLNPPVGGTSPTIIDGMGVFHTYQHGIYINGRAVIHGDNIVVTDSNVAAGSNAAVYLDAAASNVRVGHLDVKSLGYTPAYGILAIVGATDFYFDGGHIQGATTAPITDGTTTATPKAFRNFSTSLGVPTIVAAVSGSLTIANGSDTFKLGTTNAVGQIGSDGAWDGREVKLLGTGVVNVFATNNIKLSATMPFTVDDVLTLVCVQGIWYEMSRSAN